MRVKYHGYHDLSVGYFLDDASRIAEEFDVAKRIYRLNDILELHNVAQFLDHPALRDRTTLRGGTYQDLRPQLRKSVSRYFRSFSRENIARRTSRIEFEYIDDFFMLFVKARCSRVISARQMKNLLVRNSIPLRSLLQWKELVRDYEDILRELLVQNPASAEIILDHYLADSGNSKGSNLYISGALTSKDKTRLLEAYIDSECSNLNYLRLIVESRDTTGLKISTPLRLKSRRKAEAETTAFFEEETGLRIRYLVAFEEGQQEARIERFEDNEYSVLISKDWLASHLKNSDIVNCFIFLFDLVDRYTMMKLPSFRTDLSALDLVIGVSSSSAYKMGSTFKARDIVSLLEMSLYRDFLLENGTRLETVIEWFFNSYLASEFEVPAFSIQMPSAQSTYVEKCSQIFPEMESALKQFYYLVQDGELDQDLVRLSTWQVDYRALPSLFSEKYACVASGNNDIARILYLLFSDQAGLGYLRENLRSDTLFGLINSTSISMDDFHSYQVPSVLWLREQRILKLRGRRLEFTSIPKIEVLLLLNHYEAVNIGRLWSDQRKALSALRSAGHVEVKSTLFSTPEADYFDYHLNLRRFGNGLNLKNVYSH